MSGEIAKAVLTGALVSITPDCYPCRDKVNYLRVSMTRQTWNGMVTLNREIPVGATPEQTDADIVHAVMEMLGTIETPYKWKGVKLCGRWRLST